MYSKKYSETYKAWKTTIYSSKPISFSHLHSKVVRLQLMVGLHYF